MQRVIKNQKGITIVFALFGLLLFGVVSTVIYNSSISNLNSVKKEKEYQQVYLTVSSAANLFADSIVGDSVKWNAVSHVVDGVEGNPTYADWTYVDENLKNPMFEDLKTTIKAQNNATTYSSSYDKTYTYFVYAENDGTSLDTVQIDVKITEFNIIAFAHLANPVGNNDYYMTIKIPGVFSKGDSPIENKTEEESEEDISIIEYYVSYDRSNLSIVKGIDDDEQ